MVTDVTDLLLHKQKSSPCGSLLAFCCEDAAGVGWPEEGDTGGGGVGGDEALCPHSRVAGMGALEGLWGTQGEGGSDTSGLSFLGGFQPPHSLMFPAQKPLNHIRFGLIVCRALSRCGF